MITDEALRYITQNLKFLEKINISDCGSVTDSGIAVLCSVDKLIELNMSGCPSLTDSSLNSLQTLKKLKKLDCRRCELITKESCERFLSFESPSSSAKSTETPSTSIRLVNIKKKIIATINGAWSMPEDKYFTKKIF